MPSLYLSMQMNQLMLQRREALLDLSTILEHSQSNCETRKWTVLGEVRVGIFAKQDILPGTELSYDYNFEWFGGAVVRCLCGSACCSGFLGAKSRGFQEATYVWEDNDDRYSVEKVPLYDSEEDEPVSVLKNNDLLHSIVVVEEENDYSSMSISLDPEGLQSEAISVEPLDCLPAEEMPMVEFSAETENDGPHSFMLNNSVPGINEGNKSCHSYPFQPGSLRRRQPLCAIGKSKIRAKKEINVKLIAEQLARKEKKDELLAFEEAKIQAASHLKSVYNEIRPTIEEYERDSQDNVPTNIAEEWIEASCCSLKAEFDLYVSVIKNLAYTPRWQREELPPKASDEENEVKYLEMG